MRQFSGPARLYLVYTSLLTFGLAVSALFFNLLLVELGYAARSVRLPLVGELSLLGLLNSLPTLVAVLSSLPLWWLVSRVGPRPALVASALLYAASLLGAAIWPAPGPLLVAVTLGGPAAVLFQVSAAPFMMRHSSPAERDLLFSLSAGLNIGVAGLGSLVGGLLPGLAAAGFDLAPQSAAAYRVTFVVAAASALLAALPLLSVKRNPQSAAQAASTPAGRVAGAAAPGAAQPSAAALAEQLRFVLRSTLDALPFMLSPLLISCGAALLIPFLNIYFRQQFGASDVMLGLIFAAIGVATGAATLLAPLLSKRLGKPQSVVLTQGLAIPCLLLLGLASTLWLAGLIALLRGALMNMAAPLYDAYAMEQSPEAARPMVIGMINGAFSAGYIIGPNISARVQQEYGFAPLFVATACFYACAALANYLLFVRPAATRGEALPS